MGREEQFSWRRVGLLVLMGLFFIAGLVWVAIGPLDLGYVRREHENERRDDEWVRRQTGEEHGREPGQETPSTDNGR